MIRHTLVHESPGYICPFCPEREHRYPRPDNLQRYIHLHLSEDEYNAYLFLLQACSCEPQGQGYE